MIFVSGVFVLSRSASLPVARIFPSAMDRAVTLAGVGEGSLGRRWAPVRMLPWM
jgi:hypothetical protein